MLFVSHANPEDNDFSRWLSLRLAAEGYPVWCDLTQLLGGEMFWSDVEAAIRTRTIKFLYVLSKTSNGKAGPRNELSLALSVERTERLKDFIIPLWIDDLDSSDFNVEVFRRNAMHFQSGWAGGLATLLKKLAQEGVPKKASFGPTAVTAWWRSFSSAAEGLKWEPESLYSNWYPLLPATLYFHELRRATTGEILAPQKLLYPAVQHAQYLVSFAPAEDLADDLGPGMTISSTVSRRLNDPSVISEPRLWGYRDERKAVSALLRQAWEQMVQSLSLPTYKFSNGIPAFYFTKGMLPDDRAWYQGYDGTRSWRNVIGYKSLKVTTTLPAMRYWHFALEPRPTTHPVIGYTMRPHVLFSDDGVRIWESKTRLHRARRSQCRGWWNDKWRDLIAASVAFLAQERATIDLPVGLNRHINIGVRPLMLTSPISFDESVLEPQAVEEDRDDDGDLEPGEIEAED